VKLRGHDREAGRFEHWLEQPPERAVLAADVLGVVLAGIPVGGILGGIVEPAVQHLGGFGRAEFVDQVLQPQHTARPQHLRDAFKSQGLPEVGQLMQRVSRVHAVQGRAVAVVAEEPGSDARQVGQAGAGGPLADHRDHGRRHIDGRHLPEPPSRGQRELPGPRAEVQHG
jgi:hypothetical protein